MISNVKAILKIATAALLSCAAALLYADEAPFVPPAQIIGFTEANQTPPFITSKDMTRGAASDGSLTFSLDMFFGTNTPNSFAISPMIQYDSAKLDIIEIANVAHAGFFKPEPSRVNDRKFKIADWSRKPEFAGADTEFLLVWMDLNEITAVSGATPENPVRLATIKFKWKAGATGASQIAIVESEAGISDENFRGVSVDIQGIEVAEATLVEPPGKTVLPPAQIRISKTRIQTAEEGGHAKFRVRLTAPLAHGENVEVNISSTDTSEATVSPALLIFTEHNWENWRNVVVRGVNDDSSDGDRNYLIRLKVNKKTGATRYRGKTASMFGTNIDDDAVVILSATPNYLCKDSIDQGAGQEIVVTAELRNADSERRREVRVDMSVSKTGESSAGNAGDMRPERLTITAKNPSATTAFSIPAGVIRGNTTFRFAGEVKKSNIRVDGQAVKPAKINVVPFDLTIVESSLNSNADEYVTAHESIIAARYAMGVRGDALARGQADPSEFDKIKAHFESCGKHLSVDENSRVTKRDGILIARYAYGLRGEELVVPPSPRPPEEVEKNIERLGCCQIVPPPKPKGRQ